MEYPDGPDPEKLLLRLSEGESLSKEEIAEIISLFESVKSEDVGRKLSIDDVYSYLVVLGRSQLKEYRHVIEKFLDVRDALTVALVLETLCLQWNCSDEYLERVISFALGVAWDEDQDVQQAAIKILGEYLNRKLPDILEDDELPEAQQLRVLELLLSLCDDESLEQWSRQAAYYALCRAYGMEWEQLPNECVLLDFSPEAGDLDREMLGELRGLVGEG